MHTRLAELADQSCRDLRRTAEVELLQCFHCREVRFLDGSPIGGIKVIAEDGWFAARPSGTEEIYKIYAESFLGQDHLGRIKEEAQVIVNAAMSRSSQRA